MQDAIWLVVCLASIAIMGVCWLLDRGELLRRLAAVSEWERRIRRHIARLRRVIRRREAVIRILEEDSEPLVVGDWETDPIRMEITLVGPEHAAVHLTWDRPLPAPAVEYDCGWVYTHGAAQMIAGGDRIARFTRAEGGIAFNLVLRVVDGVGLVQKDDLVSVCGLVCAFNSECSRLKGGDRAGAEQEVGGDDCDPGARASGADHDHGG